MTAKTIKAEIERPTESGTLLAKRSDPRKSVLRRKALGKVFT
jgi:hypothetical protein